jgi:hypothetical protein
MLEKFPLGSLEYKSTFNEEMDPSWDGAQKRVHKFRCSIDKAVFDISAKLIVIQDFITSTDSLRKALTLAHVIQRVKKVSYFILFCLFLFIFVIFVFLCFKLGRHYQMKEERELKQYVQEITQQLKHLHNLFLLNQVKHNY